VNVGLDGRFAEFAGDIIRPGEGVVLLGQPGRALEAKVRLARIGFDAVLGAVDDIEAALAAEPGLARVARRLRAADFIGQVAHPRLQVIDVRDPSETAAGMVPGARNLPLPRLLDHLEDLDPGAPTVVYCASGYRSSIAASTLRAHGFRDVVDIAGDDAACATLDLVVPAGAPGRGAD
jgi:rhodanese-related sulfurtransferase